MNNTMINNNTTEIDNITTDLRLTKHFCLSEFTRSATAIVMASAISHLNSRCNVCKRCASRCWNRCADASA